MVFKYWIMDKTVLMREIDMRKLLRWLHTEGNVKVSVKPIQEWRKIKS